MVELTSPRKIYPLPSRLWQGKVKLKRLRAESIHPLATTPQQSGATMRAKPKEPAQKKAYICHATGTEQSAQNLSAARTAAAPPRAGPADSGEVLWCGKSAMGIGFRRILGYMPQQQGLYDSYTGRCFLAYMAALKEIPRKAVAAEVDRVAAAVNLTVELDKRLSAYSGGMKQRLLLASALLGDPKLLILDEPTAGLDPKERVRLRELLADMAKDRIILVATHVVSDVETVATKVILLRAGKIVDAAPVPELIEKYAPGQGLEDVYLNVFGEGDGK